MQSRLYVFAPPVALFLSVGCGGGASAAGALAPGNDDEPADVAALMTRELPPLEKRPVASKDQGWKARTEGLSPPKVARQKDRVTVALDLGLEGPMGCEVLDDLIDMGSSFASVLAALGENLEVKHVSPYSFQMIDGEPAMFVRIVYAVEVEGEQRVGDFKFMVSPRQQHPFVCSLDVPGYSESFVRIASEFGQSFEFKSTTPDYQREEVWKTSLGDVPIGFVALRVVPGEDSLFTSITLSSMLIPASPEELSTHDEATVIVHDAKGTVMQGKWLNIENLETALDIDLVGGPGAYRYSGTFKGKSVSGKVADARLVYGQVPMTEYARRVGRREAVKPLELSEYYPSLDPTKGIPIRYTGKPHDGGASVTCEFGSMTVDFETDRDGTARSMRLDMAGMLMTGELVYENGKL
jgi:hypothetical protein